MHCVADVLVSRGGAPNGVQCHVHRLFDAVSVYMLILLALLSQAAHIPVVNMGGIELGSSDKHTQNHTYPRIARNPELRGIRGGSLCQLNPAYQKTLFSSYEMGGGMHCAVQTMFRPCSDSIWVQT